MVVNRIFKKMKCKTIENILASKCAQNVQLDEHEQQIISAQHREIIDGQVKRDFDQLSEQIFKPWFELTKTAQKAGLKSPLAKALKGINSQASIACTSPSIQSFIDTRAIPLCPGELTEPPYFFGNPSFQSVGISALGVEGFVTSQEFSIFDVGELSLGAANGRVTDDYRYPSTGNWLFGDANAADANIWEFYFPPSRPIRMEVTAEINIGDTPLIDPVGFVAGAPESLGDGLVGTYATAYLSILSPERSRTVSQRFLFRWKARSRDSDQTGSSEFLRSFSLSTALNLSGESQGILVIFGARVLAFRAGIDDPKGGFSGIDLRSRAVPTIPLWLGQPPGGPVSLERLNVRYCPNLVKI